MDESRTVPNAPSTSELEDFWMKGHLAGESEEGTPAELAETTENQRTEAIGIDMPGVGNVRPDTGATIPDRHATHTERMPELLRELTVLQLLHAASRIAAERIQKLHDGIGYLCMECFRSAAASGYIPHTPTCNTGRTLNLIRELSGEPNLLINPAKKEAAPERETSAAELRHEDGVESNGRSGDGIRARGFFDEPWRLEGYKGIPTADLDEVTRIYESRKGGAR
jgi:hypothetical protein